MAGGVNASCVHLFATVCCLARFSRVKQDLGAERTLHLTGLPWGTLALPTAAWLRAGGPQEAVGFIAQDLPGGILNKEHVSRFPQSVLGPDCLSECSDQERPTSSTRSPVASWLAAKSDKVRESGKCSE